MKRTPPWLGLLALAFSAGAPAAEEDHWAFQPIRKPDVPAVSDGTPIDAFVRARLAEEGLAPSPEAPPHVLLRRLHLDLTGLLPSPGEVAAFEAALQSDPEQAWREAVDHVLSSPHFGEQWARLWLDLARYADSDGYLGDSLRPWAWVYRDWVIEAINRDQPFDQFSIEQIAGDLLPEATRDQRIAVGFHRHSLKNTEAGADRELDRTKRVVDRVATTGTTWLGLTLACAECHDHKHDPVSQAEFYQLYAFFNNLEDKDISVRFEPEWKAWEDRRGAWDAELAALEARLAEIEPKTVEAPAPPQDWILLRPDKVEAGSTDLAIGEDGTVLASGKLPATQTYFVEVPVEKATTIRAFRLEALGSFGEGREKGETVGRGKDGAFVLSMFFPDLHVGEKKQRLLVNSAVADHHDGQSVEESYKSSLEGWRIATRTHENHEIIFTLAEPAELPSGSRLRFSIGQKFGTDNLLRQFRLTATADEGPYETSPPAVDPEWAALRLPIEKHLASPPPPPSTKAQTLAELSGEDRRETHVHVRGDYSQPGERVGAGVPAVLHPMKETEKRDRLALARWLFDPENPLTARVTVNRVWQQLFGAGLVATPDDFGTHGARPTHPELLDWLAVEFREKGWSRKKLVRTILLSSTYRQSSRNTDPDRSNELLWRQNSVRVPAETVRDIHLAASGLFTPKIGGPGVHPPLPEFVTAVGRSVKWPESTGPDRYRRGLYIFKKRTVLYPMLTTFDAPDTSVACARRERTNTPMQALTLLNDPVFYECAETLGRDLHEKHGDDTEAALADLYQRCLGREPGAQEWDVLLSAHHDFLGGEKNAELALVATARLVLNLDEFVTRD